MGRTYYSAEKNMEDRVRRVDAEANRIDRRETQKSQDISLPLDLWLSSGLEEGGILVIHGDPNIRRTIGDALTQRGHKVRQAATDRDAMTAFQKASYSLMIVPWVMYERSRDFVGMLRKAFPQTRIIITSPNFAWSSENVEGAKRGKDALDAGAYSYVPDQHINRTVLTCVESAMTAKDKSCPVLMAGLPCNLRCTLNN